MENSGLIRCSFLTAAVLAVAASISLLQAAPENKGSEAPLIVFVHGFGGSSDETWTAKDSRLNFPDVVEKSLEAPFSSYDVYTFDYPSGLQGTNFTIIEAAVKLKEDLRNRLRGRREIVFVTHSMGGLVVKELLLTEIKVAEKTRAVIRFATPMDGSRWAKLAKIFARKNPNLGPMVSADKPENYLQQLKMRWINASSVNQIPIFCFFEKKKTYGVMIVKENSAIQLCNRSAAGIDADHLSIVKPTGDWGRPILGLKAALLTLAGDEGVDIYLVDSHPRNQELSAMFVALAPLKSKFNATLISVPISDNANFLADILGMHSPDLVIAHVHAFLPRQNGGTDKELQHAYDELFKYLWKIWGYNNNAQFLLYSGGFVHNPDLAKNWLNDQKVRQTPYFTGGDPPPYMDNISVIGLPNLLDPKLHTYSEYADFLLKVDALLRDYSQDWL